ncbi:MAG TPA: aldehyde dehydrogenase family protein, partial [Baekduia sp.]|nr:aldehyde dehydrogenase family protein [Baekduia sp.]
MTRAEGSHAAATQTLVERTQHYIGGQWVDPASDDTIEVVDAATEEVMGRVPAGTPQDVDRAVAAARAAFDSWSQVPLGDRVALCSAVGMRLQDRAEEIAALIAQELGCPITLSMMIQAGLPAMTFSSQEHLVEHLPWEQQIGNSLVLREPVGVVSAITPWNYPLHQIAAKVAPAMTAGCTVVLKQSEVTPLNAYILAEIMDEVGAPDGVFNLVCGTGEAVGEPLAAHRGVDLVSLTGSTRAGTRVAALAAPTVKKVALELGGKSAAVVLEGADLARAVAEVTEQS